MLFVLVSGVSRVFTGFFLCGGSSGYPSGVCGCSRCLPGFQGLLRDLRWASEDLEVFLRGFPSTFDGVYP